MHKSDYCIYGYLLILAVCSVIYGVVVVVQSDTHGPGLTVSVVLPLDAVKNPAPTVSDIAQLNNITKTFTVTVWWGLVENADSVYDWSSYTILFNSIIGNVSDAKFKINFAFHACLGDMSCEVNVPLPIWIVDIGKTNSEIYYTDASGFTTGEYLTAGVDHVPIFNGRTAVQMYSSFIQSFLSNYNSLLDSHIYEIQVGLGPAGEFRYPAFPESKWIAPGIGQYQCYDNYLKAEYITYATKSGFADRAFLPSADWLSYNDEPEHSLFFNDTKSFKNGTASDYGVFFNQWYSNRLLQHGSAILSQATNILRTFSPNVTIATRIGCVYWLNLDDTRAAELTAGYLNYTTITEMLGDNGVGVEMGCFDLDTKKVKANFTKAANPEDLVTEVFKAASSSGIKMEGINSMIDYTSNYDRIESNCRKDISTVVGFNLRYLSDSLLSNIKVFREFLDHMTHPAKLHK